MTSRQFPTSRVLPPITTRRGAVTLLALALLVGCAPPGPPYLRMTNAELSRVLFEGQQEAVVLTAFGKPHSVISERDGTKLLIYRNAPDRSLGLPLDVLVPVKDGVVGFVLFRSGP